MSRCVQLPGVARSRDEQRAALLHVLRLSPTPGGALRRRFGNRIGQAVADAHAAGLIVSVAGDWYLTSAGRIAAKGDRA